MVRIICRNLVFDPTALTRLEATYPRLSHHTPDSRGGPHLREEMNHVPFLGYRFILTLRPDFPFYPRSFAIRGCMLKRLSRVNWSRYTLPGDFNRAKCPAKIRANLRRTCKIALHLRIQAEPERIHHLMVGRVADNQLQAVFTHTDRYDTFFFDHFFGNELQCVRRDGSLVQIDVPDTKLNRDALGQVLFVYLAPFKKYFPTLASAQAYARNPAKIANKVYANRMGNVSEASGDGYKFCGRGLIQLTGRNNYTKFANAIGKTLDQTVAYLETPEGAVASAGWFWDVNKLSIYADKGDFVGLTRRINGGTIGLEDRKHHYDIALAALR